jgi:hypothetical protein
MAVAVRVGLSYTADCCQDMIARLLQQPHSMLHLVAGCLGTCTMWCLDTSMQHRHIFCRHCVCKLCLCGSFDITTSSSGKDLPLDWAQCCVLFVFQAAALLLVAPCPVHAEKSCIPLFKGCVLFLCE